MKTQKPQNKLFRLLTAAVFLFAQLNPAWAVVTTHSVDADFAGAKLRVSDTDTTTAPKLETYYQESAADPYTAGLWHFDGNTNDSSGKAHTGALVDQATVSGTTQFMGNVLTLDGAGDYMTVPDSEDWNFGSGDFSIDFWWKDAGTASGGSKIILHRSSAGNFTAFYIGIDNGVINFYSSSNGSSWDIAGAKLIGTVSTAEFNHFSIIRQGTNFYTFKDGIEQTTWNSSAALTTVGSGPLGIGGLSAGSGFSVFGCLDSLRILKGRALTPEEIKAAAGRGPYAVYTSPVIDAGDLVTWETMSWSESGARAADGETPLDATGLVASWNFNESSGTTASNGAGPSSCGGTAANCNGTLTNFASTASQDQAAAAGSGWTNNNKRWGAGALMFDGSNDYVDFGSQPNLRFNSGNFTITGWVKPDVITNTNTLAANFNVTRGYLFGIYNSKLGYYSNAWKQANTALSTGIWYHIAITIDSSGNYIFYLNGVADGSGASVLPDIGEETFKIGAYGSGGNFGQFNGIIDSTRIYSRVLSPAEIISNYNAGNIQFQTRTGNSAAPDDGTWEAWKPATNETQLLSMDSDSANWSTASAAAIAVSNEANIKTEGPGSLKVQTGAPKIDANTAALWHMEETSGSGAYIKDASANPHHATPTGTTVVDGIFGKARKFNGSTDWMEVTDPNIGLAHTFTVCAWIYPTSASFGAIVSYANDLASRGWRIARNANGTINFGNAMGQYSSIATAPLNTWTFVCGILFQGYVYWNDIHTYINGVFDNSGHQGDTIAPNSTDDIRIGRNWADDQAGWGNIFFTGIIDEIAIYSRILSADEIAKAYRMGANHRISRTISANDMSAANLMPFYIAADRPGTYLEATIGEGPAANYEADANTVLFLHGDEIPGSTSIKDSSLSGKTITANGNAKISGMGKIGNAIAFDGTGDYLTAPNSADFQYGTGDYSLDMWVYHNSITGQQTYASDTAGASAGVYLYKTADHKLGLDYSSPIASGGTIVANRWQHIAVVRSNSQVSLFIDGALAAEASDSANLTEQVLSIGDSGNPFSGYIDEIRVIKGAAALTPGQIRQAYEYGPRSHPITIDFAAKLDSANLISGSGDTSFTVDATAYGLSQKGANLYSGDKIIIRENIDGTEYIVQGTVQAADAATGAVTVVWDSGLTFPGGFSANASVFKWQREYFDLSGSLSSQRGAITNLTIRPANGAEGRTIYLDDFRKAGDYLTDSASSTIASSANRYLQYRAIVTTSDPAVSPSLTGVTVHNSPLPARYLTVTHNDYAALAGDVETITITAKDTNGDVVTTYAPATTVSIAKTESGTQAASASLSKTSLTNADFVNGVATITLSDTEAENVEVIATDDSIATVTGTSFQVTFSPAAASKIVFTSNPQTFNANTVSAAYTVAVRDQYDNLRSADAIVLDLSSTSAGGKFDTASGGAFNGSVASITTSGGTGAFYYKDTTGGGPTLTVSKTGLVSAVQVQTVNFVTVYPILTPASYKAGAITDNTIAWTSSALPQNGKIELDFPVGYDLSGTLSVSGNTGAVVSTSGNTLVITLGAAIAVNSPVSLVVSGIKNPLFIGETGTYALRTKNASGTQIDQGTASPNTLIAPAISLLTPSDTAIKLYAGQPYEVTWSYDGGASNNIKLSYSTNGGSSYLKTIAQSEANDNSYAWTVPDDTGMNMKLKVEETFYQKMVETSDTQFNAGAYNSTALTGIGNSAEVNLLLDVNSIDFNQPTIATGGFHTVGLKADGTVVAAGSNINTETSVGNWTGIKAIAAGGDHTIGLTTNGTVVATGNNYLGPLNVGSWTDIKAIAAGTYHTIGLKTNGTVVATGNSADGQLNVGSWTGIKAIAAGSYHTIGLKTDGTVVATGSNINTETSVGNWTGIKAIAAGYYQTIGLKTDGTVVATGNNFYGLLNVDNWTGIKAIAAGFYHTIGLKTDGAVVATGNNDYGQLDVSDWPGIKQPLLSGEYLTSGAFTSAALDTGGNLEYGTLSWSADVPEQSKGGSLITNGLTAYWKMNDNAASTTVAGLNGSYDGVMNVNTNTKSAAGKIGTALNFGGNNLVTITAPNIGYAGGHTVCAWIYLTSDMGGIIHSYGNDVGNRGFMLYASAYQDIGTRLYFRQADSQQVKSSVVPINTWTFVCAQKLGTGYAPMRIYINGVVDVTSGDIDSIGAPNAIDNMYIGRIWDGDGAGWGMSYFNGHIDDVSVYNRLLTADEIEQLYYSSVRLQLSGSSDGSAWSDFVGPDGTAGTYFTTSGADIPASLDGQRYIKYKAYLATADVNYTQALNDVSITFSDNNAADRTISDVSDNTFEIARPEVTVIAPGNAGSDPNFRWIAGRSYEIKWKTRGKTSESWTIEGLWLDGQAVQYSTAILGAQTSIASSSFDGTYYHYSYSWAIPATHTLTNSAYVRITAYGTDVNNVAVTDSADSAPYFKIMASPQIALVEPISGAEWFINSANTIKWTMTEPAGDTNNKTATLQYAVDSPNFVNWVTVTAAGVNNENSQNSFVWTIDKAAALPAGAVKLKVSDNAAALTTDTTAWSFKISNPAITVSAPLSGVVWRIGSTPEIQWSTTAGVSSEVKIEYFDGTNWNTVMESEGTANDGVVANDGGFVWTVPNIDTLTGAKIRIADAQASSATYYQATIESSNFEIAKPLFTITLPTQSPLRRGGSYTFNWTNDGTMGSNLDVLYAPTGISFSSIKIQGAFSQDNKSFTWSVPTNTAVPQTTAKFQVKDLSSPFGEGTSAVFNVDKQKLTFDDSAVSGVSWPVGSQRTIGWTTEGQVTGVSIYYYKGATNIAIIDQTANNNVLPPGYTNYTNYPKTYSWTIANDDNYLASGAAKVKISARTPLDDTVISTSAAFTVREPYLTVSLPVIVQNSGKWVQGDSIAFNWSADGYLTNNGQLELAYAALSSQSDDLNTATWVPFATVNISGASVNSGSFDFRPSDYSVPAGYLALQVRDINANRPLSKGRSVIFEVSAEPYIGILAPLNTPAWRADTDQIIQWQGSGSVSSALKIEYSTDNNTWSVCKDSANANAENLASIGSFSWRVPAAIKDNTAYIRIMDTQRQVTQMSPTGITAAIKGISLTDYPGKTADESFTVDGTKTITWGPAVASSAQALAKIEYSTDVSHNTWSPVTESEGAANDGIVSDDGSFDWIVPDALSGTAKIRVGSVSAGVSAASDNNFKIIGSLEVSAPAASASWIIGTTQTVSWNALKGTFTNVKLQYSPDNGVSWKSMAGVLNAATTVTNNGAYFWTVPDDYSATAKIRVYEEAGLSNTAESSLFIIASPQISISQPSSGNNGNSALTINEPYDLKWTTTGSTGTNNLELKISYDNQANWSVLEASWPNTSSISITPTSTSVQAWVKITETSATHPGAVATAGPFTILPAPQITLSSPALNSAWTMGKQYEIKWDTQGLVFNTLRISYTLDGSVQSPVWVDIISGQSNTKSFYWTVSDLTSTLSSQANARIRIIDDTKGTVGYSELFTISIPSMSVVRPQGGEVWAVGDSAPVKWSYNGAVIGPLSLQYDASGVLSDTSPSIVANAAKTGQASGTYTYNWSVPSGAQTSSVKARVKDSQRPNSFADSAASFEVISAPTIEVTSPVDGNVFVIQDAMTVNWKVRGLSADSLSIEYWDDADLDSVKDADETLYTLSSGVSRGSSDTSDEYSGKYTGTRTITLPDNAQVSANLKLRLRDPARGYEGLAAGHFRIRGGFELRDETNTANTLASSTEWKANTAHTIKWYNKGSFANVKLEYATSSNGTSWGTYTSIIAALANSPGTDNISSYSWTVPDPHLASYPDEPPQFYYLKLKITNLADTSVFTESPAFKIGYYTVTWKVKDYDTLTLLDSLTVSSTYAGTTYWRVNNGALTSTSDARYSAKTYPRRYPYGAFSTFWSKDGYGERSDNDRSISADTEITVLLESAASAQTEYKVYAGFAYNEDTDKLKINSWLEKKGTLITSADADVGVGGDGYVKIYDGETLKATLTDSTVDSNGNYWFEADSVVKAVSDGGLGLESGRTYFARMGIWYRSREYQSGAAFEVTISKSLKEVTDEIKTMNEGIKNDVASVTSMVSTEAAATRNELKTQLDSGTAVIKEKLASEVSDLKAQASKILTAAETTIPDKLSADLATAIRSDVKPHIKSGILNRENVVKTGQSLTIRYRTETGKFPAISIYNSRNVLTVSGTAMTEVSGTGIYEYTATFTGSWGVGDFSVVCSESSLGTVDAMVITVIKHTLDEVAGMTSSVMGSTSSLSDFKGMGASLVNIDAQFKDLEQSLSGIGRNIVSKVQETKVVVSEMESVYNQLANLSAQIKSIGATKNVNLEKLYEVSQEKKEDIIYLKNKAEELKAVMEINKKMTENVAKKPIVQSWFEYR